MDIKNKNIKTFSKHLEDRYGKVGTEKRTDFEIKAKSFAIGELIKEERKQARMTQERLAEKIGAKKVISPGLRMENQISSFLLFTN